MNTYAVLRDLEDALKRHGYVVVERRVAAKPARLFGRHRERHVVVLEVEHE